jgi:peptidyl-dipeptidase Dcp
VTGANTNPELEKIQAQEAPKMAAHRDAIYLNPKLFQRVQTIYNQMGSLGLDAESKRLVEIYYKHFVHAGAKLSPEDKEKLKKLNEEESTLTNAFRSKVLAATKAGAFVTTDKAALKGLTDAQIAAAATAAKARGKGGYLLPLQNTTQQPVLASLDGRSAAETTTRGPRWCGWPSCGRRRPRCWVSRPMRRGSWRTRWPRRRMRRSSLWMRWCRLQPPMRWPKPKISKP